MLKSAGNIANITDKADGSYDVVFRCDSPYPVAAARASIEQAIDTRLAGLSRAAFLDELARRKVSASQVTLEELREELARE